MTNESTLSSVKKIGNIRWRVALVLTAATAINYLDRMTLPVVIAELQKKFGITEGQFAALNSFFLLAYAIMYAGGGKIADWLGTRLGYSLMMLWWSLSCAAQGLVSGFRGLAVFRFSLGIGEGGSFPNSAKTVSEWFPAKERSMAFGMFNTGSAVGSVVAPPLMALIVVLLSWRWVFIISGSFGVIWAVYWLFSYHRPQSHPRITPEEAALIRRSQEEEGRGDLAEQTHREKWIKLFSHREVRCLLIAKFLTDPVWFFYLFWLPKYLYDTRGFDIKKIGYYAWIPYAAAGIGSLFGGWFSSFLIKKGVTLNASRKIALGMSASLMPLAAFVVPSSTGLAIVFISLAFLGHQFWSVIIQTLPADLYPQGTVGSVAGLIGASGSFGAMLFAMIVGYILGHYATYLPVFITVSLLHPIAFGLILVMIPRIAPKKMVLQNP
ncbi:MAG: MFS transporter [Candidatus Aminicenantes bacterium]|nr:MFS transporter [Candidatus Aminicenantes bacterium]